LITYDESILPSGASSIHRREIEAEYMFEIVIYNYNNAILSRSLKDRDADREEAYLGEILNSRPASTVLSPTCKAQKAETGGYSLKILEYS
jgi:hypothetical protein